MSHCHTATQPEEIQLTRDLRYNHDLDNNDNFSPDNQWLVYDTRTHAGGIAASSRIERVRVPSGEKEVLYELPHNQDWGPGAGAVSYCPTRPEVAFIHGLPSVTASNPYQQWRRLGAIVQDERPGQATFLDARHVVPHFTPGALRGGTHRHEWSHDGQWIGYTYNDALMEALERTTGQPHNLRTIGVSKRGKAVQVPDTATGENYPGAWYSVLVVRVVPQPQPGSDEISRAASDSWVGQQGYLKPDGTRQIARAFLGTVKDKQGKDVNEVFVVDIPEEIDQPGEYGPLEGTSTQLPMPPKGTSQRRLTRTADTQYPGCSGIVRSSADGSQLAYLARDQAGIQQLFVISPTGGTSRQLTRHSSDVQGYFRWHPDGQRLAYVWDGSIVLCALETTSDDASAQRLTSASQPGPTNLVWAHDGQTLAYNRYVKSTTGSDSTKQIFLLKVPLSR
ncbi:hypothetical protein HNQ92_000996 [Rhabdobacter roseus]|uniref:DUF3748 domain-containing protein n=1 Tax=Rhabdobacter roseus TaxID=1655419 RepID=A0A840TIX1_9BACT|nr:DUF3748 domain-containing protein [Rhabdobacter roseus]MBB5282875.1 hypothetical protein [Rhabdobacter roseus]